MKNEFKKYGGGTPATNNESFWSGKIPWISSADVYEDDIISINETRFINEIALNNSATKLIPQNSIIIVSRVGVGKVVVNKDHALCTSQDFTSLFSSNNNPFYFAYLFSKLLKKKISQGSTIKGISSKEIQNLNLVIPGLDEQNKIANFLLSVDERIKLIKRKISTLKKYKEGLIKKLINSSNKEMKLSQLITVCEKTKLQSSYGKTSGKYKFFINSSDEITKWSDDYIFDGEYLILNTGGTAFTNYVNGKFSAMSDCLVVKPNSEHSINIYYWLKAVEKWINEVGFQGTGLKHLDVNWLLRQQVKMVEYDNKKLSNLNIKLNSIIELNNIVLEKLKVIKNIFLNLMFI